MVKSSEDTRYAKDSVVTHDGIGFPCWAIPDLMSFPDMFGQDAYDKVKSFWGNLFLIVRICIEIFVFLMIDLTA